MPDIKLIVTSDGSHSLLNEKLNETYHSVHGAIQESLHVFIDNGLSYFIEKHSPSEVSIFEVGFGTGLNALLTVKAMQNANVVVKYVSIEAFPIGEALYAGLNYTKILGFEDAFAFLHRSPWQKVNKISDHVELLKLQTTLENVQLTNGSFDVVFFDAFAPNKQPELWTIEMLHKVVSAMKSNGVFVTYCAKGQLKRDLKELGLNVETLPGPPGKKEMVRAVKPTD
ncbi:MAG TPA: tRNA (5-methylaminomethyl-2-thiouridine)(34)-methyltransferase MnmD [Chryseolinea sp.]